METEVERLRAGVETLKAALNDCLLSRDRLIELRRQDTAKIAAVREALDSEDESKWIVRRLRMILDGDACGQLTTREG